MQKILVIDNNEDTLYLLKNLLETNGYPTATLSRGETAFKMIETFRPELILLDINLEEQDGRDICMAVKNTARTKNIRVILFSGIFTAKKDYEQYGCDAFIEKPVKAKQLLKKINLLLNNN